MYGSEKVNKLWADQHWFNASYSRCGNFPVPKFSRNYDYVTFHEVKNSRFHIFL